MASQQFITLQEATEQYLKALEEAGKSPRTIYTYTKDCEQMIAFFGSDKKLINILPAHVAKFYKSDALLKISKNGKERAPKTINKTKMVFKGLLSWAKEQGHIEGLPLPKRN
jgi:site-specific recombinase XerD